MRVCFLLSGATYGGAETVVCQLVASLDKSKSICIVFKKGTFYDSLMEQGIKVYYLDEVRYNIIQLILCVRKILIEETVFIVHSHCIKESIIGSLATIGTRAKNIATVHGADESRCERRIKRMYNYIKQEIQQLAFLLRYKAIVIVSPNLINEFRRYGNKRKVTVVRNGILGKQEGAVRKQSILNDLRVNENVFIVGVVGRICQVKNQEYLINVIENNVEMLKEFVFVFVGEGSLLSMLSERARKIENIIFLRFQRDILGIISCFDLLVSTSIREGNPIVLIEAFMLRIPVLASNVLGNNEIIIDKHNGMLFDLENPEEFVEKLVQLRNDSELRKRISDNGYSTYMNEYTNDIMAKRYIDIYNRIVMKG